MPRTPNGRPSRCCSTPDSRCLTERAGYVLRLRQNSLPRPLFMLAIVLLLAWHPLVLHAAGLPHHTLTVSLDPGRHKLSASDTITVPGDFPREFTFALHAGLNPSSPDPGVHIRKKARQDADAPLEVFLVTLPRGANTFTVAYSGSIYHPLIASQNQARGFDQTPGSIAGEGVYLAASSAWYPLLETDFFTFTLTIVLPVEWDAVSQGGRRLRDRMKTGESVEWDSPEPQNEIYLIASRFKTYEKTKGKLTAMVYLRTPDEGLASRYLDATMQYIAMYDRLIGPYPYAKFALVENFWETGFGMPSFTLLGPTVLRLPFIINTSYPHEILHNWWGNSVYPVYEKGNWSEGITAYLADHLLKEQQGQGADYRLTTLQKYADYVSSGRDFPLTRFTARHSPSTEAVGYGKALMFFHMLRLELGDKAFIKGLRDFYRDYKFHYATFADIDKSFSASSGRDLKAEFDQWITKTGAPEIRLENVRPRSNGQGSKDGNGSIIAFRMRQVQQGRPYRMHIPVAVTLEHAEQAYQTVVEMNEGEREFELAVPSRALRLDIDPEFDLFRRLDRGEVPPAITQPLGAKKMLVILPAIAGKKMLDAYRAFAQDLADAGPDAVDVKLDSEVSKLPIDRAVAVLGWENRFLQGLEPAWKEYEVSFGAKAIRINRTAIAKMNHSVVLTARNPGNRDAGLLFIAADRPEPLPGLGRKLPHYHKYSYLAFEGDEPANVAKGRWPVVDSPLTAFLDAKHVEMARLAPREALASLPPVYSEERMMETIRLLAGEMLKGREIGTPEIDRAAGYLALQFKQAGLLPGGDDGSFFQAWKDPSRGIVMKNVIGVIRGMNRKFSSQSVVIGAHYDHLGMGMNIGRTEDRGRIHPGADDNASGVAVLLELARVLKETLKPDRNIVFAAFTGEEEGKLGSNYYIKYGRAYPVSNCIGMVNLDTVGRLGRKKLLVLGGSSAKEWVHIFRGAWFVTGVEIDMVSENLDSSDQMSFQEAGVPAVQLFSGPHLDYHRPSDTIDTIDSAGLVKAASVTKEVVEYLSGREAPLTSTLKPGEAPPAGPKTERKVSLGTIPDFSFHGKGVRLSGVAEGSPSALAGMREGDVITGIDSQAVNDLKDFSDALKRAKPGEKLSISFTRNGKEMTVQTAVQAR